MDKIDIAVGPVLPVLKVLRLNHNPLSEEFDWLKPQHFLGNN